MDYTSYHTIFSKYMTEKISLRVMYDIQETTFNKLHLFFQHFYGKWKLGELFTRTVDDSIKVRDAIVQTFANLMPQIITLIAVIIYLFTINWHLTLFTLTAVPIFVVTITYFTSLLKRLADQIQRKTANINHIVHEALVNMKLIQAYVNEDHSKQKYKNMNHKNFISQMKATRLLETKKE